MAPATLRRHLAVLVDAGLIIRRDSPNGKRYARKDRGGEIAFAFGFDLSPLVARAAEFASSAEAVREEERGVPAGSGEDHPLPARHRENDRDGRGGGRPDAPEPGPGRPAGRTSIRCSGVFSIASRGPPPRLELEPIASELSTLADEVLNLLERHLKTQEMSANESQFERHKQNSKPDHFPDLEPHPQKERGAPSAPIPLRQKTPDGVFPLGMVLEGLSRPRRPTPRAAAASRTGGISWRP